LTGATPFEMPQRLSDLPPGSSAIIERLASGVPALTRLREMGLVPGTVIQLVRRAPLGDAIEISVRGGLLSLRRSEAELIEVTAR
jgi:ferrous iron transport protein A